MPDAELVRLRIFTAADQRLVEIENHGERISDLLNSAAGLRLRAVSVEEGVSPGSIAWTQIDPDEMLVVVPPPKATDRTRRLHRPGKEVRVQVGPYFVTGAAHVPAGAQPSGFLLRHRPHFLPLTRATIGRMDGGQDTTSVSVAIVNLRMTESLREASGTV
jgi:hypothetical protein